MTELMTADAWAEDVNAKAGRLEEPFRADFFHLAYVAGAKVVIASLGGEALPSSPITDYLDEEPTAQDVTAANYRAVEVPAGFAAADSPAYKYWIGERNAGRAELPGPLTYAGLRRSLGRAAQGEDKLPLVYIRRIAEGQEVPQEVKLHDTNSPMTRALGRSDETLEQFGSSLIVISRAVDVKLPEIEYPRLASAA